MLLLPLPQYVAPPLPLSPPKIWLLLAPFAAYPRTTKTPTGPSGRRLPAAAVAEPGAQGKPGRRGTSCIARLLLPPRHNGGARAAERAAEQRIYIAWRTNNLYYFARWKIPRSMNVRYPQLFAPTQTDLTRTNHSCKCCQQNPPCLAYTPD